MPPTARTRVTNGSAVMLGVDGRSLYARRFRDVVALHIADLGGDEAVSEAERSLVKRIAGMTVELERMEADFANEAGATPTALDLYNRTAGNLRRCLETIGLQRRTRDVTPTIESYLRAKAERGSDDYAA